MSKAKSRCTTSKVNGCRKNGVTFCTTTTTTTTTTTIPRICDQNRCPASVTSTRSTGRCNTTGHCSNNPATTCTSDSACGTGNTCTGQPTCMSDSDCPGASCITDGVLQVDGLPPFPFPLGVVTKVEIGPADATCKHTAVVPAGGFTVPHFDLMALNYCSKVETLGCQSGNGVGAGAVWDGGAPCPDGDVITNGDTSAAPCATLGTGCTTGAGGAGADTLADIDTVIGDGACDPGGVNTELSIPVISTTWSDSVCTPFVNPGCCVGSDFNVADGDTIITQFPFLLRPTSSVGKARWHDKNGDGCAKAGNGPLGSCSNRTSLNCNVDSGCVGTCTSGHCTNDPSATCTGNTDCSFGTCTDYVTAKGSPAVGPCCVVGQKTTVVSVGLAPSGGAPLYDLTFKSVIPTQITDCSQPSTNATCVVSTDPCKQ